MPASPVTGPLRILGYCDRPSVRPGETLSFFVSCAEELDIFQADIVKLVHGDLDPKGPGYKEEVVKTPINGEYRARTQLLHPGSHALVPDHAALALTGGFSIQALIWPTTPGNGPQGIVTKWLQDQQAGYGLFI